MNTSRKTICFIALDTLLELASENVYSQKMLLSAIVDVFDNHGTVVIEIHYANAPSDRVGVYFSVDGFMRRYRNVFNKISL